MRALILNGGPGRCGDTVDALQRTFTHELTENGWDVDPIVLRDLAIAYCQGEFDCCIVTPGVCKINDAARDVARAYIQSDLVVLLTPVTFGGYSAELKKAVDRFAFPLLSPFFIRVHGETHHPRRYRRYPRLVAVGVQPYPDAQSEQIFRFLVARNALTLHARAHAVGVITPQMEVCDVQAEVQRVLGVVNAVSDSAPNGSARAPRPMQPAVPADLPLTPAPDPLAQAAPPQRALLLVGSARQMPSMSNSLGTYLLERLQERGVLTQTMFLHRSLWNDRSRRALLDAVDSADVLVLAFPVYVDSLPYLVTRTLELLADHRGQHSQAAAPRLLCITNSGLPEVSHTRTALAICRRFAQEVGFTWVGGLALGGGQAVRPSIFTFNTSAAPLLAQAPAWSGNIKRSLDLVGAALVEGRPAPEEALTLMARPLVPPWAYRLIGSMNWYREAWKRGTLRRLADRPYQFGGRAHAPAAPHRAARPAPASGAIRDRSAQRTPPG